jgi:NodT family efflux transporter outer membrane factor (OMF) lipoprotein
MQTHRTALISISLSALLSACTVGPSYVRPDVDTGKGWSETVPQTARHVDLSAWWRSFDDATLDRLVERALAENLDLREAAARIGEARALRDAAAGGRYPQVQAQAGITRRRQSENGPLPIDRIPGIARDQTIYEPGFDARWELDLFGGTRRRIEAANARLQAAIDKQHAVRLSVAAETARSYFLLRGAQHELDARREALAAVRQATALVHTQYAAGDVPQAAVAQADAELAALEARLPALQASVRTAALSIGVLLGGLPESELGLAGSTPGYLRLTPLPVGKRADLLRRRPDVAAAERELAAATADIGVAKAELFPHLTIGANGGFQSLATGDLFDSASQVAGLAPLISWRVFDGGRVRAQIRASNARAEAAALEYEKTVKQALLGAETALTRYDYGLQALARQDKAVAAAQHSYRFANMRYRSGDISLLQLLDAERVLRNAQEAYAQTHTSAATDLIALFKALGGGWQVPSG